MHKRFHRSVVRFFGLFNALLLAFQPLALLPAYYTVPQVIQAESTISIDQVSLSFDAPSHEFSLRVKTDQSVPYVLSYVDEAQDPQVTQAAQGDLQQIEPGVYGDTVYAGTCSAGVCTPVTFSHGTLALGDSFKVDFQLVDGVIVFTSRPTLNGQVCVNPEDPILTAGDTLWTIDEASQTAETHGAVKLGVQYQYPLDPTVMVRFTCLPADESEWSNLKIQRVLISELSLPDSIKTDAEYGYDITTSMANGTFEYTLELPKPEGENVGVAYINKTIDEAKLSIDATDVIQITQNTDVKLIQQPNDSDVTISGLDHFTIFVHTSDWQCLNDIDGQNDKPGQKDLTQLCTDTSTSNPLNITWNWDETDMGNGNNSADGCSLFDTDNDGLANYALCVSWKHDRVQDATSPILYSCNDTKSDRCAGNQVQTIQNGSTCETSLDTTGPFSSGADHPNDTTANCEINLDDVGGSALARVINVCSYPSQQPNSDPSDCVLSTVATTPTPTLEPSPTETPTPTPTETPAPTPTETPTPTPEVRVYCGDGEVNQESEQCDYGSENGQSTCSAQCTWVNECRADMVTDGSFESPVVTNGAKWDIFGNAEVPGWTAEWVGGSATFGVHDRPDPQIELHHGVLGAAADGDQYVELDTDWGGPDDNYSGEPASIALSQSIPTIPGNQYTVSWQYAARPNYASNDMTVSVGGSQVWDSGVMAGGNTIEWKTESYTFVATDPLTKISFTEVGPADSLGMFLDDVSVSCDGPAVTPTPTPPACTEGSTWAALVEEADQSTLKNGNPITDPTRMDSSRILGAADGQFFSLGYHGSVTASFAGYVINQPNADDLSFHEVTNGRSSYPVETAEVFVSQNNSDWISLGTVSNKDGGNGVGYKDLDTVGLSWIKYVKVVDVTDDPSLPSNADGYDLDAIDATQQICDRENLPISVLAQKIVCDTEADLPNWGNHGATIGATTAADYVDAHPNSCHLENDWQFQWSPNGGSYGDFQTNTDPLGDPWTTFSANTPITILPSALTDGRIEVRELVANPDTMVPFSNDAGSVGSSVSSELYCTGDVYNYDNWEWVSNPQPNQTYYCVAFNALAAPKTNDVTVCKEDQSGNPLEGWTIGLSKTTGFDEKIPVTSGAGINTPLVAGDYVVYSSGYYKYRTAEQIADAGFSYRSTDIPPYLDGWVSGDLLNTVGALELKINGSDYSWGGYNPNHQYFGVVNGFAGGNLNLSIFDTGYGDNSNTGDFRASIGQIIATDQTGENGCVTFSDVEYGDYGVFEAPQAGWAYQSATIGDTVSQQFPAVVTVADEVPSVVLTNRQQGSIAGLKFEDNNMNGQQNNGDVGLADWHFNLRNADGNLLLDSTVSDDQGNFNFGNVPDGTYQVCEVTQAGWVNSNPGGTGDEICQTLEIEPGQTSDIYFGNFELGAIQGRKYQDDNQDGTRNGGESWLADWAIRLYKDTQNGWSQVGETTTAGNQGIYRFDNLTLGTYYTCEVLQDGWKQTGPLLSGSNHVANQSPNASEEGPVCWRSVINHSGQARTSRQFGNIHQGQVTVSKFEDLNTNGVWDEDESLLADWEMNLATESGVLASQTTDDNGSTTFVLDPGTYNLSETEQKGWLQSGMYCNGQEVLFDRIQEQDQQIVDSNSLSLTVNPEDQISCYVGNYQPGTIEGYKYFDANQNGSFDEGEQTLSDWQITLFGNDDETTVTTDEDGSYQFGDLIKGSYTVCEEDRTADGWITEEPAEGLCHEVEVGQSGQVIDANFGNYIESELYILKTNSAWPNDQSVGSTVTYTIKLLALGGPISGVRVFDLPPKQFSYVLGSYTAHSSDGTDLKGNGTTTEPTYASPGTWNVGDMSNGEIVTLTYQAVVGTLADPGVYPDMVWATGTSEQSRQTDGGSDDLLALSDPDVQATNGDSSFDGSQGHYGADNFAGTQVAIVQDLTPYSEYQVSRTEEKQGQVLGASTELPATGAHSWFTILALLSTAAGATLLFLNRKHSKVLGVILALGAALALSSGSAQAVTSTRIEAPYNTSTSYTQNADTNQETMRVDFVVLNTDDLSVTAQCQQRDNGGSWNNITTNYTVKAGGNSGYCETSGLENNHYYDFRVVVSGDGADQTSSSVRVNLDTERPDKPVSYSKSTGNYCEDKIYFKTADDGQTSRVDVYRSDNADTFTAKPDTRIAQITIGTNQEYTLTTSKPDCQKTYYYVIRAFDDNGNASDLVGDTEVTTVIIETSTGSQTTVQVGALPVSSSFVGTGAGSGSSTTDASETETTSPTDGADENQATSDSESTENTSDSEGSVLGASTESVISFLTRFGLPIGVGLVVLVGIYLVFFHRRNDR